MPRVLPARPAGARRSGWQRRGRRAVGEGSVAKFSGSTSKGVGGTSSVVPLSSRFSRLTVYLPGRASGPLPSLGRPVVIVAATHWLGAGHGPVPGHRRSQLTRCRPGRVRAAQPPHHLPGCVLDGQDQRGRPRGPRLSEVPGGVEHILVLAFELLLLFPAGGLLGLERIFQVISERRSEGRVGGRVEARSLDTPFLRRPGRGRDVQQGLLDGQDRRRLVCDSVWSGAAAGCSRRGCRCPGQRCRRPGRSPAAGFPGRGPRWAACRP